MWKTRLLKEFIKRFNDYFGERAVAIYIDALERISLEKALLTSRTVELAEEVIGKSINEFLSKGFGIGRVLADSISIILENVVRAVGLNQIEWYVKWLYELLWKLVEEYKPEALSFIVTTSEGRSLDLVSRHRHTHIRLIWNLDKQAFKELFYELKPREDVDFEEVWRLLGGNPGKLIELAKRFEWNLEEMKEYYKKLLHTVALKLWKEDLVNDLTSVLDDIDMLFNKPSANMSKLQELLTERNLIIYKNMITLHKTEIPFNTEIGVGKYFAWQVPLYREALKGIFNS